MYQNGTYIIYIYVRVLIHLFHVFIIYLYHSITCTYHLRLKDLVIPIECDFIYFSGK